MRAYPTGTLDINTIGGPGDRGDINRCCYDAVSPIPLDSVPEDESVYLRTAALYALAKQEHDQFVKTHCAQRFVEGVELIPQAFSKGAVYLVRDPRDVAISFAHHRGSSIDEAIDLMGQPITIWKDNISQYLGTWSENVESWLKSPFPTLVTRYEAMLGGNVFHDIAYFVFGERDPGKVHAAVEVTRFDRVQAQEKENGFVERPEQSKQFFRRGGSSWRNVLAKRQISKIERDHGDVMQRFGYV